MAPLCVLGVNLIILLDKRVRYVKKRLRTTGIDSLNLFMLCNNSVFVAVLFWFIYALQQQRVRGCIILIYLCFATTACSWLY